LKVTSDKSSSASRFIEIPLVSIVTPSFNQGRFINATIRSVLEQNHDAVELIVMDGGSTDGTTDILKSWGDEIAWVSEKDAGQSDAIIRGFARAKGNIFGWVNSDDTLAPGAIRAAVDYLNDHPDVAMVYGDANFIDASGRQIRRCAHVEPFDHERLTNVSDFIVQPAAFFRRSAYEAVGGLNAKLHWAMDYDLWLKIASRYKVAYLPKVLANYRWVGTNKSADGGHARLAEVARVAKAHGASELPAYFKLETVALTLAEALHAGRSGSVSQAIKLLAESVRHLRSSERAMQSLFNWRTWRVIWTGQVLRRSARESSSHR